VVGGALPDADVDVARKKRFRYDGEPPSHLSVQPPREGAPAMKLGSNTGMMLLGIWLIVTGLQFFLNIKFDAMPTIMATLAVAAGVLLLMNK
jgi:hypothetical protein